MAKVFKNLKSSVFAILIVICLLVLQAQGDLALPQYISNIVNIGIQQGGIDSIVPNEIRKSEFDRLTLFMDKGDVDTLKSHYKENPDNSKTYILKDKLNKEDKEKLEDILGLPIMATYAIEGGYNESGSEIDMSGSGMAETSGFDMSKLDDQTKMKLAQLGKDATAFDMMAVLPDDARAEVVKSVKEKFSAYTEQSDSIISQMGISWVKSEYKAIGINTDKLQSNYIWNAGLKMLGFALIIAVATVCTALLTSRIGARFARDLRSDMFHKVVKFSNSDFGKFSSASLITRCTNDIQQVQMLVTMVLRMVIYAPIIGIGALFKVTGSGNNLTWIIGLAVGLILVLIIFLLVVAMPKFKVLQTLIDKLNLVSREILTGLPVIRAFSREKHEEKRFDEANTKLMKTQLFVNRVMTVMMPAMMFIMNGICVLIIWAGASQIDKGNMQVGDLLAMIQYTMQIIMAFLVLSMMSVMLPRALVSVTRISEVLNTECSITDPENPQKLDDSKKGLVEFKNVSFAYPGAEEYVLKDISFTAKPGETTAFIGSTGSGKSTLINLVPRFFDVTEGEILVDGVDIRNVSMHDLRERIGYVPQKGQLFSGTIESNIGYGLEEYDEDAVKTAAEISQSTEFIESKPEKYESEVSQGGTNVSGGQRQRLSIARAIAKNPEIYIFDDSFSALDFKTDASLRKALWAHAGGSTVLLVAQRISTVLNADQIVVLDEGEIVGIGKHKELMKNCEIYRNIALSQLSREEME